MNAPQTGSVPRDAAGPRPSWVKRHLGKLLASLVVAGAFGWLLHAGALPLVPRREAFADMKWWTVPAYIVLWSFVHVLRAVRWHFLLVPLHAVGLRKIIAVSFIGFAAIVLLPLRAGEAVRPVLIRKKGHLSGWAATGTIGAERVIDGLLLSLMLLFALSFATELSPLPDHIGNLPVSVKVVPSAAYAALGVFALAFTVMAVFYWRRKWARHTTERILGLISPRFAGWLADKVEHVADGLRFLPELRYSAPFIALTASYWIINAAGAWLLAWGAGFSDFTFAQACVTTGVLALGILVPNAPGFFGAYQISLYAAFAMYYPTSMVVGPGAACVFVAYLSQLGITIAGGALGLLLEHTSVSEALETN